MVQITIDTDKESPENIRRLIQFLQTLVQEAPPTPQFRPETPQVTTEGGMFDVFEGNSDVPDKPSVSDMLAAPVEDEEDEDSNFFSLMEY